MSTLAYAALTTRRDEAEPGTSTSTSPPGLQSYVDAVAALVPAEVLTLHALILSITTTTVTNADGNSITTVTEPATLQWAFWGLVVSSVVLYVVPRFRAKDRLDVVRALIPAFSFVAWTMLQRTTAFDAVWPDLESAPRTVVALFAAAVLGLAATTLAKKADKRPRTAK